MRARVGIDMGVWAWGNRGKMQPGCWAKAACGMGVHVDMDKAQ